MNQSLTILAAAAAHAGGFGLHEKLIVGSTAIVVLILIVLAMVARSQVGVVPRGLGAAFEHVFDWVDNMAQDMIGHGSRQYVPLLMSFFLFILFSNWSGLVPLPVLSLGAEQHSHATTAEGLRGVDSDVKQELEEQGEPDAASGNEEERHLMFEPPTASYNTTLALAMISFFAFNWFGIKKNVFPRWGAAASHHHDDAHAHHSSGGIAGIFRWIGHYGQPTPMLWRTMDGGMKYFLVPLLGILFVGLNIMEEIARILSLSLRLFGNISGEHQVKVTLLGVMRSFLGQSMMGFQAGNFIAGPAWLGVAGMIWGAALFATLLAALAGFVQAMVFTMLSMVYISHAVADEH